MDLLAHVREAYGIELSDLERVSGGADSSAETFRAGDYFLKLSLGVTSGVALSATLFEAGNDAVLAPIRTLAGRLSHTTSNGELLLYPYIEGANGFQRPLEFKHWRQLGEVVRKVHDTSVSHLELPIEDFQVKGLKGFAVTRMRLLSGDVQTEEEALLAALLAKFDEDVSIAVERVQLLALSMAAQLWPLVPSHADLHVGNILVDAEDKIHLIDWDNPRLAPRECDLMFMMFGGILNAHGAMEEMNFFDGYGEVATDPDLISYYRYARVVEDFVAYAEEATNPDAFPNGSAPDAVSSFAQVIKGAKLLNETIPDP